LQSVQRALRACGGALRACGDGKPPYKMPLFR